MNRSSTPEIRSCSFPTEASHALGSVNTLDDARELGEHAIARQLDEAPVMGGDPRVDQLGAVALLADERASLVSLARRAR